MRRCGWWSRWGWVVGMVGVGVVVWVLYAPMLGHGFVGLDDSLYTVETREVREGLSWGHVRWAFTRVHESWYAPLLWISLMVDASVWGGDEALGWLVGNWILHGVNVMVLYGILHRVGRDGWGAFFGALLWGIHPLRVESVAWVAERKDVLSGLFFLLAVGLWLWGGEGVGGRRAGRVMGVSVLMGLGLLVKTSVVVLPLALLILDYWPLGRVDRACWWRSGWGLVWEKWPLWLLGVGGSWVTVFVSHVGSWAEAGAGVSWLIRAAYVGPAYWRHLLGVVWPVGLSLFYEVTYLCWWECLAGWMGLCGVSVWLWWKRRVAPFLWAGWVWFLVIFLPMIRGIRWDEQNPFADRYTYLPTVGLSLAFVGLWGFRGRAKGGGRGG